MVGPWRWSSGQPSTSMTRVQIPLKSSIVVEKNEKKQKVAVVGPLKNWKSALTYLMRLNPNVNAKNPDHGSS